MSYNCVRNKQFIGRATKLSIKNIKTAHEEPVLIKIISYLSF